MPQNCDKKAMEKKFEWFEQIRKKIFYKSDIFCKLFHFQSRFPVPALFPLATLFWVVAISQYFFTLFYLFRLSYFVVVPSKKELLPIKLLWLDVEYFGSHTVRYCEDGFLWNCWCVTREIVQPAKASNFSENRLLKRASPHDTETIYQLLYSSMPHYSLI